MFTSILAFKCNTELQNSLFPTKPELYGTFGGKVGPKMHFSTIILYYGTFGGPLAKWGQKLHFSPLSLYYGTFGGPLTKWGQKLHFSLNAVNIKGPSGPLSFRKGPFGPLY